MTAEIIDKNGHIKMAINSIGIQIGPEALETILNMSDFVRHRVENKKDVTIRDVAEMEWLVQSLFSEEIVDPPKEMKMGG